MKILLGADFHLGARLAWLGESAEARRDDLLRSFERFVQFALDPRQKIDLVLLAGDLFDHHAPPAPVADLALGGLERLVAAGRAVALIPGLHDGYAYVDSIYRAERWPAGVGVLRSPAATRTTLEVAGASVHLYAMAWDPGRTPAEPLAGFRRDAAAGPGVHIGLLHASLPVGPEWERRRHDFPLSLDTLSRCDLDLVLLGHHHEFAEQRFGRTTVVYPGTIEGIDPTEIGERALSVAEFEGGLCRISRAPFAGRPLQLTTLDFERDGLTSLRALEERIAGLAGRDRIVRVRLTGRAAFACRQARLVEKLGPLFFHLDIEDDNVTLDERWTERLAGERTIRGLFVGKLRERISVAPEADRARLKEALRIGLAEFAAQEVSDAA